MPLLVRCLLMLSLLCTLLLGGGAAYACHPAAAAPPQAATQPTDTLDAHHHRQAVRAPVTPAQPSLTLPCKACSACAGHCPGVVASATTALAPMEADGYQTLALPAPAGIVLAPEPRPPRA